ncbi:hypothetical protein [Mycolicibacterium wolinskyi]|uniref:hypothetical protein n=1 Tax=Mycolicibacterium wolinskyi TaxID=59750 RepID=UPI003BA96AC4
MSTFERRFRLGQKQNFAFTRTVRIHQVYWRLGHGWSLRIRQEDEPTDYKQTVAIKGPRKGSDRPEMRMPIFESMSDDEKIQTLPLLTALLGTGQPYAIDKTRSFFDEGGVTWELDEFHGKHAGLIIAEVHSPDRAAIDAITPPKWADLEVTADTRYNNENLAYEDCTWIQEPF